MSNNLAISHKDIDECEENSDICGLGTCSNNDDGTFYECECQDGAMATGSGGNLTCTGMVIGLTQLALSVFPGLV